MFTLDVSVMAQCRNCQGFLVSHTDHCGTYFVHTGTLSIRCPARHAAGKTADPARPANLVLPAEAVGGGAR